MFELCVNDPNVSLGVYDNDNLIAIGILYLIDDEENLMHNIKEYKNEKSGNFKLAMVNPLYRGHGLMFILMNKLESVARKKGFTYLCTTVHPDNFYSKRNILKSGYKLYSIQEKYGGLKRELYIKKIS